MRRTVPAAILLVGLGVTGLGTVYCGETTSPVGAMKDVVNAQACSPVGSTAKASDGCNACTCSQSGQWACTTVACAALDGGGDSAGGPDAASSDGGCIGSPPTNGCNLCFCTAGNWMCTVTQCPPGDASRSDGPALPKDASTDAPARVVCGSVTCGPGEWCDTSGANPTCRCGPINGSCGAGLECCAILSSGCGAAHCNELCAAKNDAGPNVTCP